MKRLGNRGLWKCRQGWFTNESVPVNSQELMDEASSIRDHTVEVNGVEDRLFLGNSPWCCMSVGNNYYAAPHKVSCPLCSVHSSRPATRGLRMVPTGCGGVLQDRLDVHGAVVRFAGECDLSSNEFVMPELGVAIQTPPMCVLWCRTDRVRHGTLRPEFEAVARKLGVAEGGCPPPPRLATARQLKKTVLTHIKRIIAGKEQVARQTAEVGGRQMDPADCPPLVTGDSAELAQRGQTSSAKIAADLQLLQCHGVAVIGEADAGGGGG